VATVKNEPQHFFYLNNGLTAFCSRLEVHNLDRANADSKRITAFRVSIINGAQTLGSVNQHFSTKPDQMPDGYVFLKMISLEKCEDDQAFADRITRSSNFQNQIGSRDFAALDEQQERIAKHLQLSSINYHYKQADDTPESDASNFTLEEATTACACLEQQKNCDFCARLLSNRASLWSFDEVYPAADILRTRYSRIFRPDRSARTVWRAVQAQRLVIKSMQESGRASKGIRKTFFENARWLVLNAVYLKLHPEQGEDLQLTLGEEAEVTKAAIEYAESLFDVCEKSGYVSRRPGGVSGDADPFEQQRHFKSIFGVATDCEVLRKALLAQLTKPEPAPIAPNPKSEGN
jgi:hypothetical protein